MAIHQCIYTNSAKGLERGGGAGVYSYSPDMTKDEERAFVQGYCSYPRREKSRAMEETEDIEDGTDGKQGGLPTKLLYGTVCGGRRLIANVTFLGKDYTGDMGRMGNILSHMYSFDEGELPDYPIRYYLSPDFRTSMNKEEVDGSRPVRPLAQVDRIAVSDKITVEGVQRFLEGDGRESRMEMFCHMMAALINRDSVHRVIIYDTHDHILLWIGALEYALPLKIAANISFSSFDYNPMMSDFEIRGCVAGECRVGIEELKLQEQHYVFDGIHMEYPRFDISEDFYQYGMEVGMGFAYDSLKSFHEFLDGYRYDKLDGEIYTAFRLFQMQQTDMSGCSAKELLNVLPFEERYGSRDTCMAFLKQLTEALGQTKGDAGDGLWKTYKEFLTGRGSGVLTDACMLLHSMEAWGFLGELTGDICAGEIAGGQDFRCLKDCYNRYFVSAAPDGQAAFDLTVQAAAEKLKAENEEAQYEKEMELFLLVQDISGGRVHGRGMEELIAGVDQKTLLIRPARGMFKKSGVSMSQKQRNFLEAVCSYEAHYGLQKEPVRLKLLALGSAVQNALRMRGRLSEVKELQSCQAKPVCVQKIGEEELAAYWRAVLEGCEAEMTGEDMKCLLQATAMTKMQSEAFLEILMAPALKAWEKGQQGGMRALFAALWSTKEAGYDLLAAEQFKKCRKKQLKELYELLAFFERTGGLSKEASEHFKGLLMQDEEAQPEHKKWHLGGKHGGIQWRTKK